MLKRRRQKAATGGGEAKPRQAHVLLRSGRWIVEVWSWYHSLGAFDQIGAVFDSEPSDEELGKAVLDALSRTRDLPADLFHGDVPLWKQQSDRGDDAARTLGFKSNSDMVRGAKVVDVVLRGASLELDPMRNLGPARGFEGRGADHRRVLTDFDTSDVGAAVRDAMGDAL